MDALGVTQAVRAASALSPSASAIPPAQSSPAGMSGVSGMSSVSDVSGVSGSTPFAGLVTEAVESVDRLEKQAKVAIEGLMSGAGVDVHEAMIASEKAEMGFELALSVRNKALAAYQQVIGMQF